MFDPDPPAVDTRHARYRTSDRMRGPPQCYPSHHPGEMGSDSGQVLEQKRMAKWVGLLALILAAGLSLAACSESSKSPTTTRTSPSSSTSSSQVATPTTATSSTTGVAPSTSTSVVTQTSCGVGQLRIQAGEGGRALGSVGQTVVFTNVGQTTCTMMGYPGVAALNAQGDQVAQAVRHPTGMIGGLPNDSSPIPVVTLAPGQTASAEIEGSDTPPGTATTCVGYPSFLVTPPGETHSVGVSVSTVDNSYGGFPGCYPISVNPVVPGVTGRSE